MIQALSIIVGAGLLLFVIELVRRKKLSEEYSWVWILCAVALLGLAIGRSLLDRMALAIGIFYPPAALILVVIFFVFVASVSFSVVVSRQRQQIEQLIEETALLEARVRELAEVASAQRDPDPDATPPGRSA